MPALANIGALKADGVTAITYTAMNPSSGDNVPALWRSLTPTVPYAGLKPWITMLSKWNQKKDARRVNIQMMYPSCIQDTTTEKWSPIGNIVADISIVMPQGIPQGDIDEAVMQLFSAVWDVNFRAAVKAGFAPT